MENFTYSLVTVELRKTDKSIRDLFDDFMLNHDFIKLNKLSATWIFKSTTEISEDKLMNSISKLLDFAANKFGIEDYSYAIQTGLNKSKLYNCN